MVTEVKYLQKGYAMKIKDYRDFPFKEIMEMYYPRLNNLDMADKLEITSSQVSQLKNKKYRKKVADINDLLNRLNIEMILLRNDKYFRDDLEIKDLIIDKALTAKKIGLSRTYFYNERYSYRIDIYLDILAYIGLELAIIEKGN